MPFARVIVLALALTHAVGLFEQIRRETCEQECRDDGCGDGCVPGDTHACRCHAPGATTLLGVTPQTVAMVESPMILAPRGPADREHASPDPREILHVPRRAA